jgi:transposase InsO family protein
MNSHCERFNRTLEEMFIDFHEDLLFSDLKTFNEKLAEWLIKYNTIIPHHSIELLSPIHYPECHMYWTKTIHCTIR